MARHQFTVRAARDASIDQLFLRTAFFFVPRFIVDFLRTVFFAVLFFAVAFFLRVVFLAVLFLAVLFFADAFFLAVFLREVVLAGHSPRSLDVGVPERAFLRVDAIAFSLPPVRFLIAVTRCFSVAMS